MEIDRPGTTPEGSVVDADRGAITEAAWLRITRLFAAYNLSPPPVRLRDELVHYLLWARQGALLHEALEPFTDISGEGDEDYPDETPVTIQFGRTTHYAIKLGDLRRAQQVHYDSPLGRVE